MAPSNDASTPQQIQHDKCTMPPPRGPGVGLISILIFRWITPLLQIAQTRPIELDDVYDVQDGNKSQFVVEEFETVCSVYRDPETQHTENKGLLNHDQSPQRRFLVLALRDMFWKELAIAGFWKLLNDACNILVPLILRSIIFFMEEREALRMHTTTYGLALVCILSLVFVFQSVFFNKYFSMINLTSIRARSALSGKMIRKSLKLSARSRAQYPSGKVQNLVSTDSRRISETLQFLNMIWSSILQIVASLILLVQLVGFLPSLAGLLVLMLASPLQAKLMMYIKVCRDQALAFTDSRIRLLSELFDGIKSVKLFAWEESIMDKVGETRTRELWYVRWSGVMFALGMTLVSSLPILLSTATFAAYALLGYPLDAAIVFPAIAVFNILRPPLIILPNLLTNIAQAMSSIDRIEEFLQAEEREDRSASEETTETPFPTEPKDLMIQLDHASVSWVPGQKPSPSSWSSLSSASLSELAESSSFSMLHDISLDICRGDFIAVIGSTASYKSTLLAGILNEAYIVEGNIQVRPHASVAFVDQTPFIMNATIRENVCFNRPFESQRYYRALFASDLMKDVRQMATRDMTEIGARGVNLSGGQKQRLAIARAVYADADIYLFDDPLSAVDAHVGSHIFQECMVKELRSKTRVLVTNQLHLLARSKVDKIVCLNIKGQVEAIGTFDELVDKSVHDDASILNRLKEFNSQHGGDEDSKMDDIIDDVIAEGLSESIEELKSENKEASSGVLTMKETRSEGDVDLAVYVGYMKACGGIVVVSVIILLNILAQFFQVLSGLWLSHWSSLEGSDSGNGEKSESLNLLGVYVGISMVSLVFGLFASVFLALVSFRASLTLHHRMLCTILGAPLSWYDQTPTGRIINRFSTDVDKVDNSVSSTLQTFMRMTLNAIATVILIVFVTPLFLIPLALVGYVFYRVQRFFRRGGIELKRLEGVSRSPLHTIIGESCDGLTTIRAFQLGHFVEAKCMKIMDDLNKVTLAGLYANRWLAVRLELLSTVLIFCSASFAVASRGLVSSAITGLLLSYSTQLTTVVTWVVRTYSDTEQQMQSVERIEEYSSSPDPVPNEMNLVNIQEEQEKVRRIRNWPKGGHIVFDKVCLRYRQDLPLTLQEVSFEIESGERIGIVGRTGSGKSSLLSALFRLTPIESGKIVVDSKDLDGLPIRIVRSSFGIIPQESFVMSGTIRYNMDPFGLYEDDEIWAALRSCGLAPFLESTELGLDWHVDERGANLSQGQRQLMSLARTLLRDSPILVLDEATASIDVATDAMIQQTLKSDLKRHKRTMLTIAHRINTILDYDKIMVMDAGKLVEFGPPQQLLQMENGIFAGLYKEYTVSAKEEPKLEAAMAALQKPDLEFGPSPSHPTSSAVLNRLRGAFAELRQIIVEAESGPDEERMPVSQLADMVRFGVIKLELFLKSYLGPDSIRGRKLCLTDIKQGCLSIDQDPTQHNDLTWNPSTLAAVSGAQYNPEFYSGSDFVRSTRPKEDEGSELQRSMTSFQGAEKLSRGQSLLPKAESRRTEEDEQNALNKRMRSMPIHGLRYGSIKQ